MAKAPTVSKLQKQMAKLKLQEAKLQHIDEARDYVKRIIHVMRGYATSPEAEKLSTLREMIETLSVKVAPYDPDQMAAANADMFEQQAHATTTPEEACSTAPHEATVMSMAEPV